MLKKYPDIMPVTLGSGILMVRMYRADQSFQDIVAPERNLKIAVKLAIEELIQPDTQFYKCEAVALQRDGTAIPYPNLHVFTQDALPYYVKYEDDKREHHEVRFIRRVDAYAFYTDLQRQDYLILVTNSHPVKNSLTSERRAKQ